MITLVVIVIYGRYAYVRWKHKPVKRCLHALSSKPRVNGHMNLIKILMVTPKQKGEPVNVLKNLLWKLLITAYVENVTMSCPIKTVFNIFLLIYIETRAISWEWRSVHGFEKHVLFHFWKSVILHYKKRKCFLEYFRHKFYSSEKIFTIIRTRQHSAPLRPRSSIAVKFMSL